MIVNIAEAKAQLSELASRASQGEEIILARHGQPIARLVPLAHIVPAAPGRGFGIGRGDFTVPDDFDEPLPPEMLDLFEGGGTNIAMSLLLDTNVWLWWTAWNDYETVGNGPPER